MNNLSLKVLLIEDNPGDARLIQEMLRESKSIRYKLEWIDKLSPGLIQLTGDAIDVVLLDLLLPDSHGLETLERTLSHTKEVPIVVLTGIDDEELAIHALRHGAQDYLVKGDMNSSLLGRSISYAIERKRSEVALQRAHDTLEERVRERTDAFVMQNKKLLQEIEERRRAENERWKSENRYHLFVESSPIGILFYDTQLHLIDCNARFESFSKVDRENIIGFDLNTLNDKKVMQIFRESLEGESGVFEGLYKMTISGDEMWINMKSAPLFNIDGTIIGGAATIEDITERVLAKQALEKGKAELEVKTRYLEDTNMALKVLLNRIEEDKIEIQENVLTNIKHLILPLIEKIKVSSSKTEIDGCVEVLEKSLNNIVSPFLRNMSLKHYYLTPKEMYVANLVKEGKTNKEIAALMNVSLRSVEVHRDNIRGKLDIKHKKANLRSILLSMS